MLYTSRICSIFPLWMESKALVKSTNSIVACRFFARTPSMFLRIINMNIYVSSINLFLYYYYIILRVFHTNVSWWFFTAVWVRASLPKSPGIFSVFWPTRVSRWSFTGIWVAASLLKTPRLFSVSWPTSVSRWSFTEVWVTASLLKSPGLFSVFCPTSTTLLSGWSPFVLWFLNLPAP